MEYDDAQRCVATSIGALGGYLLKRHRRRGAKIGGTRGPCS